jgi:hypothetical protein
MGLFKRRSPPADSTVTVPDGHEVTVYGPTFVPGLQRTRGGTLIANLGAASDESEGELQRIVELIDRAVAEESANQSPVLVTTDVGEISDLFAPNDVPVNALPGLVIWIIDADSAHLWLRNPEPLLQAIRRVGAYNVADDSITQLVMIAIEWRPMAAGAGKREKLTPELGPPPATAGFLQLLASTEVTVLAVPKDGVCFVEVARPDAVVGAPRGEDITKLIEAGADDATHDAEVPCHYVIRAPQLRRLILAAMEQSSEASRRQLYGELLTREIGLLVISDREGGIRPMTWPDRGPALPVFPDVQSVRHTVQDLQMDTDNVTWVHLTPRDLCAWVKDAPFDVALNVFKDRQTPLYLRLDKDEVSALARGELPT